MRQSQKVKGSKIAFVIAILLILSAGVIFLKNVFTNVINIAFIFLFMLMCFDNAFRKFGGFKFATNKGFGIFFSTCFIIINVCLFFVFRGTNDQPTFAIFWYVVFLFCLYLKKDILDKSVEYFSNIMLIIVILALLNLVISLLGIQLPFLTYSASTRDTTYYIYPGTVRLYGQDYDILGRTGFRLAGIFPEPSIMGILCALVVYSKAFKTNKIKNSIIIAGAILSLSLGAYVTLLGYVFFHLGTVRQRIAVASLVILIIGIANVLLPHEILSRFVLNKITGDTLNDRVTGNFEYFYNNFISTGSWQQFFFGDGVNVMENNGFIVSDYRAYFLKYGIVGIALYFIWLWNVTKGNVLKTKIAITYIFLVVFFHRSWFINSFVIMFMIYYLSFNEKVKIKKNAKNEELLGDGDNDYRLADRLQ